MNVVLESVENIMGQGKNAGYQHFLPFPTMFSELLALYISNHLIQMKCIVGKCFQVRKGLLLRGKGSSVSQGGKRFCSSEKGNIFTY